MVNKPKAERELDFRSRPWNRFGVIGGWLVSRQRAHTEGLMVRVRDLTDPPKEGQSLLSGLEKDFFSDSRW